jgi:hypothetical protein
MCVVTKDHSPMFVLVELLHCCKNDQLCATEPRSFVRSDRLSFVR